MEVSGPPHEALFLVLPYLPLHHLLSMTRVCKSLHDAIDDDVLLWLDLIVERPLNLRLTDDRLLKIAIKAHGRLRTLALLNCVRISDHGLRKVIHANPLLTKLYVPDCTGLTPRTVLEAVKTLPTMSKIYISGLYNIEHEHLRELQNHVVKTAQTKPRFYHKYSCSLFRCLDESGSSVDVDICPKCKEVKLVFDCPKEECKARNDSVKECVGCIDCIHRCEDCGQCISIEDDDELGETLCNDDLCLNCWFGLPKCNYCNKPYCPRHAYKETTADSGGFVCGACEMKCQAHS